MVVAIAGLAFVLQMAFVPLHLGSNDHVLPAASGTHAHTHGPSGHGGHGHHHDGHPHDGQHHGGHPESDAPDSGHEPHPVGDHLDQLAEPAVPPTLAHVTLALAPKSFTLLAPSAPSSRRADAPETCPRPPPPRDTGPPRGPPIAA